MNASALRASLLVAALASSASADVLVVAPGVPGAFETPQAAVLASTDFDTVLIQSNAEFSDALVIDGRALNVLADTGFSPSIRAIIVRNITSEQSVVIRGIRSFPTLANRIATVVENSAGSVRLEQVVSSGLPGASPTLSSPGFDGSAAMSAFNCVDVALVDCEFFGGSGGSLVEEDDQFNVTDGGDAVVLRSSTVSFLGCEFTGGAGGSVSDTVSVTAGNGGAGMVNKTATAYFTGGMAVGGRGGIGDCDIFGCGGGGKGGDGFVQEQASAFTFFRGGSLMGGAAGSGGDGQTSTPGIATDFEAGGFEVFPAAPRDFSFHSPVREGELLTLTVAAQPGDAALLLASTGLAQAMAPAFQGPLLVDAGALLPVISLGTAPELSFVVPDLPAGVEDIVVHLQLVFDDGQDLLLAPARSLTLLDATL